MKTQLFRFLLIGLGAAVFQNVQAASIKSTPPTTTPALTTAKQPSPIEKALEQLKRDDNKQHSVNSDKLKVRAFTATQKEPTQHFLAEQNQQFSRILQNIFQIQGS